MKKTKRKQQKNEALPVENTKNIEYVKYSIFVLILIIILCIGYTIKTFQNDTFYSVAIGRDILKYGVDMLDHYSFHSLNYTYPHWLFDVMVYAIYSFSGFKSLYLATILFYILLASLVYFLTYKLYNNIFMSSVFSVILIICVPHFMTMRAQILTYMLFVLEYYTIEKFMATSNKKLLIILPIISILIVNLHCAVWPFFFILFLPSVAEYLIYCYREKEIKIKKIYKPKGKYLPFKNSIKLFDDKLTIKSNPCVKWLILLAIICSFTGFLTLNGTTPYTYVIKTFQGNTLNWIGEHLPPTIIFYKNFIFYFCCVAFIFVFFKEKIELRDFFLVLGLLILSLNSYRHISLFIILGTFWCVKYFSLHLKNSNLIITDIIVKYFNKPLIRLLLLLTIGLLSISNYFIVGKINEQKYLDDELCPVAAVNFIKKNIDYKNKRIYNDYNYGSYMLYKGIPVFTDSRADLYTAPFNKTGNDITEDNLSFLDKYHEIFKKYNISYALIYVDSGSYKLFSLETSFIEIYKDKYYAIFDVTSDLD